MSSEKDTEALLELMHKVYKIVGPRSLLDLETVATPLQMDALVYLHTHPQSPAKELGEYLAISISATSQLVNRLVAAGFIKRNNDSKDRRVILLSLTKHGEQVFSRLRKMRVEKKREIIGLIPRKDIKEIIRIFSKLLRTLESQKKTKN